MKRFFVVCMILLFSAGLFAGGQSESGSEAAAEPIVLEYSTVAVPNAPHGRGQAKFAEEVERLTNGEVIIKNYYGGELYTQEAQNSALRRGNLALTNQGPNWFSEFTPFMNMFAMAYLFEDLDHMNVVMNGEIGKGIYDTLAEETGVRPLSTWYLGTRQLNLVDIGRIPKIPQDMNGVKLRMPNSRTWLMMGEALGANPTPVSISELYLALQTGAVEGQDNPLTTVVQRKFQEVTEYVILTNHFVNPIMPVINDDIFQGLSREHQDALLEAAEIARQHVEDIILTTTADARKEIEAAGVEFIEVDQQAWKEYAVNHYMQNKDFVATFDMDLMERVEALAN
jgi:TRAP-type transport system periplasmic protein